MTLLVAAVAAPFPFGSTDSAAIAFWCIVLGVGVIAASPRDFRREHLPLLGVAIVVYLVFAFVLHEQLSARPWIASPNPLWSEAAETIHTAIVPSVSIARNRPFTALGAPLANLLAVICSFSVCLDRGRAHQLLRAIAWSGIAYAIYGIAAYLLDPIHLLWREKIAYRDVLTSTFINRNTAAVYFGSCAILWLLFLSQNLRRHLEPGPIRWARVPLRLLSHVPRSVVIPFAMLLLCLTAMLMTNSRAGIVLSLIVLVFTAVGFFYRDLPRRSGLAAALAIGGITALLVLQFLGGSVSGRFDIQGLSGEGRFESYHSTLRMIADHPWFGTGLGTFVWSFPSYRNASFSMWGTWDRAHSTPLEVASDLGIPLAVLIALAWLFVLAVLIRGISRRRHDRIVPIGALAVTLLGLAHSFIDFSLQIPGYAIIVFEILGAGLAQSFSGIKMSSKDSNIAA